MLSNFLKKVLPAPLHPPIRGATLFVIVPLRQRLRRTWRSGVKRRVRGRRKLLEPLWLRVRLRLWYWRTHIHPAEPSNEIHLLNPLRSAAAGAPLRTVHLFEELKDHREVSLWSEHLYKSHEVDPQIAKKYPVKRIVPERFQFPKTGTFVFVGSRPTKIGSWIRYTYPRRIILVHNSDITPDEFRRRLRQLSKAGRREVEVVYASELSKRRVGNYPGFVQASLIDLDRFVPSPSKKLSESASASFTVGRLSRPASLKHHPDDPALYRQLVDHGCRVRIMGPSQQLKAKLRGLQSIELLPGYAQKAHLFLQELDCFFYRTSENYLEPSGRVVTEAMACGLPVVCHNRGGYVEWIDDGRNGFLFDTQQEALEIVLKLKEEPALRERVGKEARRTAEELFSDAVRSEIVEFYLR